MVGGDSWSGTWKLERSELLLSNLKGDLEPIYIFKVGKLVPNLEESMILEEAEKYSLSRH